MSGLVYALPLTVTALLSPLPSLVAYVLSL